MIHILLPLLKCHLHILFVWQTTFYFIVLFVLFSYNKNSLYIFVFADVICILVHECSSS